MSEKVYKSFGCRKQYNQSYLLVTYCLMNWVFLSSSGVVWYVAIFINSLSTDTRDFSRGRSAVKHSPGCPLLSFHINSIVSVPEIRSSGNWDCLCLLCIRTDPANRRIHFACVQRWSTLCLRKLLYRTAGSLLPDSRPDFVFGYHL